MKKTYIQPMAALLCAQPTTLMAASGGATADLDDGQNGGFKDNEITVDPNGSDETDAKYNAWSTWEE